MYLVRPPVAELVFRLYPRPLHPELFDALKARRVRHGDFDLALRLTPTGHVIEYRFGSHVLTEVTAAAGQELPAGAVGGPVKGERRQRFDRPGLRYQVSVSAERLPPEVFAQVQDELAADGASRGLLFAHPRHSRIGLTPLGLIVAGGVPGGLSVGAFHTFPDDHTVVKTQALIEPV